MNIAVVDAGVVDRLARVRQQELLGKLHEKVLIEQYVLKTEILEAKKTPAITKQFANDLPGFMEAKWVQSVDGSLRQIRDIDQKGDKARLLRVNEGELRGISLALEIKATTFLSNDRDALKAAKAKGLEAWNTLDRDSENSWTTVLAPFATSSSAPNRNTSYPDSVNFIMKSP